MARVFVSYCHAEPDKGLATALVESLRKKHEVYWDDDLLPGQRWASVLEKEVKRSAFMLLLVSEASIKSDMVRGEIELARAAGCIVLPVRVCFGGALPYDLGSYLSAIHYVSWNAPVDTELLIDKLHRAIAAQEVIPAIPPAPSLESVQHLYRATEGQGMPLPGADPRFVLDMGAVHTSSPYYVLRKTDELATEQLVAGTRTLVVKGHRQSGKSSLLVRLAKAARQAGSTALYIDFQLFSEQSLTTTPALCRELVEAIARELGEPSAPGGAPMQVDDCTVWMGQVLARHPESLTLILDEADRPLGVKEANAFFAMLRAWDGRFGEPHWDRFRQVLSHSTEPLLWIKDHNQSPFNIGFPIKLLELKREQVTWLNDKLGSPLLEQNIPDLLELVSGHPYLVRRALFELKTGSYDLAGLKEQGHLPRGPFGDHLRRVTFMIQQSPALTSAARKLLRGRKGLNETEKEALLVAGLVLPEDTTRFRCLIYHNYLEAELQPQGWWQRLFS